MVVRYVRQEHITDKFLVIVRVYFYFPRLVCVPEVKVAHVCIRRLVKSRFVNGLQAGIRLYILFRNGLQFVLIRAFLRNANPQVIAYVNTPFIYSRLGDTQITISPYRHRIVCEKADYPHRRTSITAYIAISIDTGRVLRAFRGRPPSACTRRLFSHKLIDNLFNTRICP